MKKILSICIFSLGLIIADNFVEYGPTFGGYGEMHYNVESESLDFHRFVLFFNNQFDDNWSIKSELELEHNMVGKSYEGELELEQAFINYHSDVFGFKGGVILMPTGIINEYHEPPTFLSVERPDYNKYIIPTTWFGNGFQFYGNMGSFHWSVTLFEDMVGEGIGNLGSSKYAIRNGRGKGENATTIDWTKNVELGWSGMGMKVGISMTMNDAPINGAACETDEDDLSNTTCSGYLGSVGVDLNELNFSYNANNFHVVFETATINYDWSNTFVTNWNDLDGLVGYISDDDELVNGIAYTDGQNSASGMYLDFGYNIGSFFGTKLVPWIRTSVFTNDDDDKTKKTSQSMFGLTYWPTDNVSIKMDMGTSEKNGTETDVFNIGLGYMF